MIRSRRLFPSVGPREAARVSRLLRGEFASGLAVMIAAALGFAAANSPLAGAYSALRGTRIGPASLGLDLTLGDWAADGLLAVFFFVVGLELKREIVSGALSRAATAIVPVVAAVGGVAVPALLYLAVNGGADAAHGWAIPTATDIAFAVAVLGLIAPRIPSSLRVFLLTLAVVDDLIAIVVIALFYSDGVRWPPLAGALALALVYGGLARGLSRWLGRARWAAWAILLPVGAAAWALVHASGVHATIAGVLLALVVPAGARSRGGADARSDEADGAEARSAAGSAAGSAARPLDLAGRFAHRFSPLSNWVAVPVFAFFAAGVPVGGGSRFPFDPIAAGVLLGLVLGKPLGIALSAWALTRFTRAELGDASWRELAGVACLGGVGFTVSLLLAGLSFADPADADTARLAVMAGSVVAALLAAAFLLRRPASRRR